MYIPFELTVKPDAVLGTGQERLGDNPATFMEGQVLLETES